VNVRTHADPSAAAGALLPLLLLLLLLLLIPLLFTKNVTARADADRARKEPTSLHHAMNDSLLFLGSF
jgi:hypothetical protein